jgi:cysteinyl-tRNA synthetase
LVYLYNTLTKRKERFEPLEEKRVKIYVCGPTTYNYIHVGNGRAFLFFDVVRRYFKFLEFKVDYVQNITDIDDKLINQSIEEKRSVESIARKYIKAFKEDVKALGIMKATKYPQATAYIKAMVDFIAQLEKKGAAYNNNGDVFFSVDKIKDYGKLSGKKPDELRVGARVAENLAKQKPGDFALWKKAKEGEPSWDSPWGKGRPGWHTECVVMSRDLLGSTFDIHCGGIDLIFPHHENEIAQAEAAHHSHLANYWMHNGFVNIEGEKMSKSLGNIFRVRDALQLYPAEALRYFYLSKHYRSTIDYNEAILKESASAVKKLKQPFSQMDESEIEIMKKTKIIPELKQEFISIMNDDFNTAKALAFLFDLAAKTKDKDESKSVHYKASLYKLGKVLGFFHNLSGVTSKNDYSDISNDLVNILVSYRSKFKKEKNYEYADMIRDDLKKAGISLKDTPEGTLWSFDSED